MLNPRRLPNAIQSLLATAAVVLSLIAACSRGSHADSSGDFDADGEMEATGQGRAAADTGPPELPRVFIDSHLAPPTGRRVTVNAGDDLQRAIDDALPGDVLLLAPGAEFVGSFTLPRKRGDGWITIRSGAPDAELPPEGERLTPKFASRLPKLVSGSEDSPALSTAPGAHHYRLLALEITVRSDVRSNGAIVQLGGWRDQTSMDEVPHHLIIDRSFVHGHALLNTKRCVALNSAYTAIVDSYLADCHGRGFDSQAIAGWNGPGPYKIVNNYLEGAGENVMFGGGEPAIRELVPSDIEIRHNHFFKPLTWKGVWTVKNIFELKNAQRVLVEGNVFENNWLDAQVGFALVLKSENQSGGAPWSVTRNVTIRYNKLLNSPGGVDIMATGNNIREPANRILIADNFFDCRGTTQLGGLGRLWQLVEDPFEIDIEHNTGFADTTALMLDTRQKSRVVVRDNIVTRGVYGISGTGQGEGNSAINFYLPGAVITHNLLIGKSNAEYPAGNLFVAHASEVGFVDFDHGNYRLSRTSRFRGAGTDGRDLGADFDALENATSGVVLRDSM
ncbi:MAG TPA: hypothetical protein VGH98_12245 [Gemmatimonadaceae bacterium]|jgi:hypothetical protein